MKWTADEFTGRRLGKYEVLCRLAIGGMAEIFLGFAHAGPFVGRPVVIKRILNERREDANALQMLLDEAKMTATLSHPNVAQVMDLETDDDEVMLVIEFINGANLEEIVENYSSRQEAVPLGFALTVIRETAQGLAHAHSHKSARGAPVPIIHRDVTPRNIMVDYDGATKVLDFGIARAKGSERRTQAGMVRGTTAYMSPEQAIGKELDPRTDLFSLGTIFHELLTGQRLFYKGNPGQEMAAVYEGEIPLPSRVNRRVPKPLDTLVMKLLERKLDKRYQSALEFIRDLSLAAGSTAWGRDRCAELVRERFAARQRDVEKLVVRIPRPSPAPQVTAPAYPEGRTIVSRTPKAGGIPLDTESGMRTLVGAQPLGARGTLEGDAGRESATDPGRPAIAGPPFPAPVAGPRPATPPPQPPTVPSQGLDPAQLFEHEAGVDTRIIPGGSLRGLPRVTAQPAEARRPQAAPEAPRPSKGPLLFAAIFALLLGGVGGAFIFRSVLAPPPPPPVAATVVRFQLSSDRPVTVFLGKQELGPTPINVFIPSGKHSLELVELGAAEGLERPRHALEVNLPASEAEAKMAVTLDSLPALP